MSERADKIYQKLEEASDKHVAAGGKIVDRIFSGKDNKVCPIAALTGDLGSGSYYLPLEKMLDDRLTVLEFNAIIAGMDGYEVKDYPPDFFEIGTKLRAKYIKKDVSSDDVR